MEGSRFESRTPFASREADPWRFVVGPAGPICDLADLSALQSANSERRRVQLLQARNACRERAHSCAGSAAAPASRTVGKTSRSSPTVRDAPGKLRLGTRRSALAWAQSLWVAERIEALKSGTRVELIPIETRGDRITDRPSSQVEGKEFFSAEIDAALLSGDVDITVHFRSRI